MQLKTTLFPRAVLTTAPQNATTASGFSAEGFHGRSYDAQHTPVGVDAWEVVLLDAAQGLGRGGVASQYDQVAAHSEEPFYTFEGVFINDIEGARTIGGAGIVAEVYVVVARELLADFTQDGQTSVSRVEYAYGAGCLC